MFIECSYAYRNTKTLEIGSGTKLLFTFLSLRFFDMRRERHNFFNNRAAYFIDPKNRLPSSRLESQLTRSEFKSQLTASFQIPKSSACRFRAWCHSCPRPYFFLGFLLWHLWLSHPPRAREHLHSMCAPN